MKNYKILEFKESDGLLVIAFAEGAAPTAIEIPIKDGLYITGKDLEDYINGFIPTWHIERLAKINSGVSNANEIKALVEAQPEVVLPTVLTPEQKQAAENDRMWEQYEFESKVAKALVKFGVLQSDPTAIDVTEL
jgi:hypothetical protein